MQEKEKKDFLKGSWLFSGLKEKTIAEIARNSISKSYKGEKTESIIFQEGEATQHIFVVVEGLVKIVLCKKNGDDHIIAFRKSGEFFGISNVLDPCAAEPLSALALARCNVLVLKIAKDIVSKLLCEPNFCINFLKLAFLLEKDYIDKVRITTEKTAVAREAFISRFLELKFPEGKPTAINRFCAADYASVRRETYVRSLPEDKKKMYFNERNEEIARRMDAKENLLAIAGDYGYKDLDSLYKVYRIVMGKPFPPSMRMKKPATGKTNASYSCLVAYKKELAKELGARNEEIVGRMESGEKLDEIARSYDIKQIKTLYEIYRLTAKKSFKTPKPLKLIERNNEIRELMDDGVDHCVIVKRYKIKYLNSLFKIYEMTAGKPFEMRPMIAKGERNKKIVAMMDSGGKPLDISEKFGIRIPAVLKIYKKHKEFQGKAGKVCESSRQTV